MTPDRFKFRAWDKKTKKMRNVVSLAFDSSQTHNNGVKVASLTGYDCIEQKEIHLHRGEIADIILMQSTGLNDADGKEMFEGDVVYGCFGIPQIAVWAVIVWKNGCLGIETIHQPKWADIGLALMCLQLRVDGNIYENPELKEKLK